VYRGVVFGLYIAETHGLLLGVVAGLGLVITVVVVLDAVGGGR